jgi:hypothetical protein
MNCSMFPIDTCEFPSVCFINSTGNVSTCGCLTTYAYMNAPHCSDASSTTIGMIVYLSFLLIVVAFELIYGLYYAVIYLLTISRQKIKKIPDLAFISLSALLTLCIVEVYLILTIISWSSPNFIGQEISSNGLYYRTYAMRVPRTSILLVIAGFALAICILMIASWYLLSMDIRNLDTYKHSRVKLVRISSFILSFSLFCIYFGLFIGNRVETNYFFGAVVSLIIIGFTHSGWSFRKQMIKSTAEIGGNDLKIKLVIRRVTITACHCVLGMCILLAGNVVRSTSPQVTSIYIGYSALTLGDVIYLPLLITGEIWTLSAMVNYGKFTLFNEGKKLILHLKPTNSQSIVVA